MANLTQAKIRQTREPAGGLVRVDRLFVAPATTVWVGGFYGVNAAKQLVQLYNSSPRVYLALEDLENPGVAASTRTVEVQFSGLVLVEFVGAVSGQSQGELVYQIDSDLVDLVTVANSRNGRLAIYNPGNTFHWVDMDKDA